jgi:hypothetical protein
LLARNQQRVHLSELVLHLLVLLDDQICRALQVGDLIRLLGYLIRLLCILVRLLGNLIRLLGNLACLLGNLARLSAHGVI